MQALNQIASTVLLGVIAVVLLFGSVTVVAHTGGFLQGSDTEYLNTTPTETAVTLGHQASTQILASNTGRRRVEIVNLTGSTTPQNVWCSVNASSTAGSGIYLAPTTTQPALSKYVITQSNLIVKSIECRTDTSTTTSAVGIVEW